MSELLVKVQSKVDEAVDICRIELVSVDGSALPAFSAGAHIDVTVEPGITRQYSLCATSKDGGYVIGVLREPQSRGGSLAMHKLMPGQTVSISVPRNHFPLAPGGKSYLFAGGIGITPILSMANELASAQRPFELHYCVRSRDRAAFFDELDVPALREYVALHCDDDPEDQRMEINKVLACPDPDAHIYVCGPAGFIDFVLDSARALGWASASLHREYFNAAPQAQEPCERFAIRLARSGKIFTIEADQTVTSVLAEQGIEIPMSCEQGVCGTCVTGVIEGIPDHRDFVLTDDERALNDKFTPCCSRSCTPLLVLDL